jgi:hypothetical protein
VKTLRFLLGALWFNVMAHCVWALLIRTTPYGAAHVVMLLGSVMGMLFVRVLDRAGSIDAQAQRLANAWAWLRRRFKRKTRRVVGDDPVVDVIRVGQGARIEVSTSSRSAWVSVLVLDGDGDAAVIDLPPAMADWVASSLASGATRIRASAESGQRSR